MTGDGVNWNSPLVRLPQWFPGQMGVPGTDSEEGLRQSTEGAIFYVDPNYPGASDQRDGTNPRDPLRTVAAALTKCEPYRGDTIAVMQSNAWLYTNAADGRRIAIAEEVVVDVPGVRIVGVSSGGTLGVMWTPASDGGTCISIHACDVTVEGFTFTEGAFAGLTAISVLWNGTTAWGDNAVIRNCTFDGTVDNAIDLEFAWYCNIYNCFFEDCDAYGIYVDPAGNGIKFCNIYNNWFLNCDKAISIRGADDCRISSNTIYNSNAQGAGVATDEGIDTTGGSNNMVIGNYFSCLLPVPANGDWDDLNTAAATDAWSGNYCQDGLAVTSPT